MMGRVLMILLILGLTSSAMAQDKVKRVARPDIPGTFLVEVGVNVGLNKPNNFSTGFWGSRTLNLYYQYPMRLWRTKFSFNPGFGLGMERFLFKNLGTLSTKPSTDGSYTYVPASTLYSGVKKSQLVANYFDIPVEFRFDTNPEDVARSFNVTVGARAGVLLDSFTKIKYKQDSETVKIKDKKDHGLNPIRYGLYGRLGVGGFSLFFYYNTSTLFKTDKGPDHTTMNMFTTGISINGF